MHSIRGTWNRPQTLIVALAAALVAGLCLEVLICATTYEGIREGDGVVLLTGLVLFFVGFRRRASAPRLALAVLSVATCLTVVELALTCLVYDAERPEAWYVWPPRYACRVVPRDMPGVEQPGRFSTNSRGIRGPEFSAKDRYRILCIGGSTTECFYLDDAHCWTRQLQAMLCEQQPETWVGSLGRSGLMSLDHLTLLEHTPEVDQVDCWVVLCGLNDMGQQLSGEYATSARDTLDRTFAYRRPGLSGRWDRPLFRNTYTFALCRDTVRRLRLAWTAGEREMIQDKDAVWYAEVRRRRQGARKVDHLPELQPLLAQYERNLERIIEVSRAKGKRLILLTQPVLWSESMPSAWEQLCWGGRRTDGTYFTTGNLAAAIDAYNQRLVEVCGRHRVECVDLAAKLPKSTATFYDDCHFNDPGAAAVARHIAQEVLRDESGYDRPPRQRQQARLNSTSTVD